VYQVVIVSALDTEARQHVLRGTEQPERPNALSPDDEAHERIFKEG
jgi:hypothetical protein